MNRNANIDQLRARFSNDSEWSLFLAFLESHKVRGCTTEIWLQWEIHLLKRQAAASTWSPMTRRYVDQYRVSDSAMFQ
jgi:hypothetical protein